jgi:hypothetical protein
MPLYFFHLSFGDRTVPDEEGVELPSRSAAREEALAVVRDRPRRLPPGKAAERQRLFSRCQR